MTFSEYINLSERTDAKLGDRDKLHWKLGLANEFGEMLGVHKKALVKGTEVDKNKLADEIGDCFWYWAKGCRMQKISVREEYSYVIITDIVPLIKLFNYYWEREDLIGIQGVLINILGNEGIDVEIALKANVEKLQMRHFDGFDVNHEKHTEAEKSINYAGKTENSSSSVGMGPSESVND